MLRLFIFCMTMTLAATTSGIAIADDTALFWGHSTSPVQSGAWPASWDKDSNSQSGTLLMQRTPATVFQVSQTNDIASGSQTWVLLAPYVWLPAQKGTLGARGVTVPVDISLSESFELLEDLNGAAMVHIEAGKGNYGVIVDTLIMQLEPTQRLAGGGTATLETTSTFIEWLGMARLVDMPLEDSSGSAFTLDFLAGVRYYEVQNEIQINPVMAPTIRAAMAKDWVDMLVGARSSFAITPDLKGFVRADFAGFGVGTSSDLTWNLVAGTEYNCSLIPGSSLILGYRILDIDETQKSGANRFVYDVRLHGPFTAFALRF